MGLTPRGAAKLPRIAPCSGGVSSEDDGNGNGAYTVNALQA